MNELTENQLKSMIKSIEQLNRGTTAYTQKLDSVIMNYGPFTVGLTFEYDNHFNTTRVVMFGPGNPAITEYTYDNQNHCIGSIITHPNGSQDKTEYTYNSQGLVDKATQYEFEDGDWEEDSQEIYEYDANGNLMVIGSLTNGLKTRAPITSIMPKATLLKPSYSILTLIG